MNKRATIVYGRFQGFTKAHKQILDTAYNKALESGSDFFIFLSKKTGNIDNPIGFPDKVRLFEKVFPAYADFIVDTDVNSPSEAFNALHRMGYDKVVGVSGSDRSVLYKRLGGNVFNEYEHIHIERDNDVSATELRQAAIDGETERFMELCAESEHTEELYESLRVGRLYNKLEKI